MDEDLENMNIDQLRAEVCHCPVDQPGAIVGRHNLHPSGQAGFELGELVSDSFYGGAGILARAHDDDAAGDLSIAIELGDPAAHLWSQLHGGHITDRNGNAGRTNAERNSAKVLEGV